MLYNPSIEIVHISRKIDPFGLDLGYRISISFKKDDIHYNYNVLVIVDSKDITTNKCNYFATLFEPSGALISEREIQANDPGEAAKIYITEEFFDDIIE